MKKQILAGNGLKVAVAVLFLAAGGFAALHGRSASSAEQKETEAAAQPAQAWSIRCNQPKDESGKTDTKAKDVPVTSQNCEIFQRLVTKDKGQRVVEFAVGFPEGKKDTARGVIILPLGILLTDDVEMQIDEGKKFKFKVRYCAPEGCVSVLDLNKGLLDQLRKGTSARITAKAMTGQPVALEIVLSGFDKAFGRLIGS